MRRIQWVGLVVALLALTNGTTFVWKHLQCRENQQQLHRQITRLQIEAQRLHQQLAEARARIEQMQVWARFGQLQRSLNTINDELNNLNFGLAQESIDLLATAIQNGTYGSQLTQHADRLLALLDEVRAAIRQKDERTARRLLIEFNRTALEILSGFAPLEKEAEAQ